jgi:hypothetical protein
MAKRRRSSMNKKTSMNENVLFLIFLGVASLITYLIVRKVDTDNVDNAPPPDQTNPPKLAESKMVVINDFSDGVIDGVIDVVNEGYDDCMGNKCICTGINGHVCINPTTAQSFYNAGLITETTIPPNGVASPQYMQGGPLCM